MHTLPTLQCLFRMGALPACIKLNSESSETHFEKIKSKRQRFICNSQTFIWITTVYLSTLNVSPFPAWAAYIHRYPNLWAAWPSLWMNSDFTDWTTALTNQLWPRLTCFSLFLHFYVFYIFTFFIFSCPEQLNRWPCHSLSQSLSH